MDLFKFRNPTAFTKMEQGEILNGLTSVLWVERYREPGEFKLVADVESGLKELLPLGTFISHTDTTEVMYVENHEITFNKGKATKIVVTGRSYDAFFENRIVGSNRPMPIVLNPYVYFAPAAYLGVQAVNMIKDLIDATLLYDDNNALPFTDVINIIMDIVVGPELDRYIQRGTLSAELIKLLALEDLGIKTIRPGTWSPIDPTDVNTLFVVYNGRNLASEVIFSHELGDIENADYLWSDKGVKTAAHVSGRWVETFVDLNPFPFESSGIHRKVLHIDASEIDGQFTTEPTGPETLDIAAIMERIGYDAIVALNGAAIIRAEISRNAGVKKYRLDYDLGDIVTVVGDYNVTAQMRVNEHVEIEDENGQSSYPTLVAT